MPLNKAILIDLRGRQLTDLRYLDDCSALETLYADCCGISDLSRLELCPHVFNFSLAGNQISNLSGLSGFGSLGLLNLSDNFIELEALQAIRSCQIVSLWLSGTPVATSPHYRGLLCYMCPAVWFLDGRPFSAEDKAEAAAFGDARGPIPVPTVPPFERKGVILSKVAMSLDPRAAKGRAEFQQEFEPTPYTNVTTTMWRARIQFLRRRMTRMHDQWTAYTSHTARPGPPGLRWPLDCDRYTKGTLAVLLGWMLYADNLPQRFVEAPQILTTMTSLHGVMAVVVEALDLPEYLAFAPMPELHGVLLDLLTELKPAVLERPQLLINVVADDADLDAVPFFSRDVWSSLNDVLLHQAKPSDAVIDTAMLCLFNIEQDAARRMARTAVPLKTIRSGLIATLPSDRQVDPAVLTTLCEMAPKVRSAIILSGHAVPYTGNEIVWDPPPVAPPPPLPAAEVKSAVMRALSSEPNDVAAKREAAINELKDIRLQSRELREPALRLAKERRERRRAKDATPTVKPVKPAPEPAPAVPKGPGIGHHIQLPGGMLGRVVDSIDSKVYVMDVEGEVHVLDLDEVTEEVQLTTVGKFGLWRHRPMTTPQAVYRPTRRPATGNTPSRPPPTVEAFARPRKGQSEFSILSTTIAKATRKLPVESWTPVSQPRAMKLDDTALNQPSTAGRDADQFLKTMAETPGSSSKVFLTEQGPDITSNLLEAENKRVATTFKEASATRSNILMQIGHTFGAQGKPPPAPRTPTTTPVPTARAVKKPTTWYRTPSAQKGRNTLGTPMLTVSSVMMADRAFPFKPTQTRPRSAYVDRIGDQSRFEFRAGDTDPMTTDANVGHVGKVLSDRISVGGQLEYYCRWDRRKPLAPKYVWLREVDLLRDELAGYIPKAMVKAPTETGDDTSDM